MSAEADEISSDLLDRVRAACAALPAASADGPKITADFLELYYRHVPPEDIAERSPQELGGIVLRHRRLAELRPQGRAKVQAFTPTVEADGWAVAHSVIEIVTDDMPFLVDSVTMELARRGVGVHQVIHPQLRVIRSVDGRLVEVLGNGAPPTLAGESVAHGAKFAESWMHIEIDRQSGAAELKRLQDDLERVLTDVRQVDEDAAKMRLRALDLADRLESGAEVPEGAGVPGDEVSDGVELLRWLAGGHFTFLGYREYDLVEAPEGPDSGGGEALRPVPGTGLGLLRADKATSESFARLPEEVRAKAREPHVLILTKANSRSTVHRPHYLDYVGVKRFDASGAVVGERRFLGLFTRDAYSAGISHVPVLRRKLTEVLRRAELDPESHDGKDLIELLESYPRDELFQTGVDDLLPIARGVLRLRQRRQTKLFLRRDTYGRFMSCLVYLPRDRYTTQVRVEIQRVLTDAFGSTSFDYSAMVSDSQLARLHVVVRGERGRPLPVVDQAELEARVIAATRSWDDDLIEALTERFGPDRAAALLRSYAGALPEGYKADVPAADALGDLAALEELYGEADGGAAGEGATSVRLCPGPQRGQWRLRLFRTDRPVSLSDVLPMLERMGVEVVDERPYPVAPSRERSRPAWIYVFGLRYPEEADAVAGLSGAPVPRAGGALTRPEDYIELFGDAFMAMWRGEVESDSFNALVLRAGLTWRQITVLRAYSRYLRQTGITFSQSYIERVLVSNVHLASLLVRLFESRFDPRHQGGEGERTAAITEEIMGELDAVANLDHDRILRTFLACVDATLRTNYFQAARSGAEGAPPFHPYLVLKLDPERIPDLPLPRPRLEAFVYSPRVEGVHLRFGPVARGGLRWSERPQDFRTEILGLVKAQTVKNAVIVPTGAKGGFVCKRLPAGGDRDAVMAEVVACYRQFISALLDITDNLVGGRVVPPDGVVRYDGDDTYLVVAADKGTATFSDIANEIAAEYGFWLGDAFASGGSVGYDHKAMGITARGAWESVKLHFREIGVDVMSTPFTAVGIGDMSGDVFGNGMLLSEHTRLVAAFDHRHIFVDPDPDPAVGFAERRRLFELPRSSWEDYDPALISPGGGVFSRTAKSVPVGPQLRAALGLPEDVARLSPPELIQAVLRAPVDLLWNGGIGTYVKAASESHAAAGDKANDHVRIDASELRCRVVGEGGNLGLTQLARIEFALAGGMVNTDFIDNSAGVDTSDHEVNIKIMLDRAVRSGELSRAERDELFLAMTDEVAGLVLRNNYHQNVVLAASRKQAPQLLHVHGRYLRELERSGRLDRRLEFLPDAKAIAERRSSGAGLTGPELSVLHAYTKIDLAERTLESDLPDDPFLQARLVRYFPTPLRERFAERMADHPLRREIITKAVVNDLVNRSGSTFAFRMREETGADVPAIVRAFSVSRNVFDLRGFWHAVEQLDERVSTATQLKLLLECRKLSERGSRWLLLNRPARYPIGEVVNFFREGVATIVPQLPELLRGRDLAGFQERRDQLVKADVPVELAERTAAMVPAFSTFDLVEVAADRGEPVRRVAEVYFDLADRLQIARLRDRVIALPRDDRWNTMARSALRDELYAAHAKLTLTVLSTTAPGGGAAERVAAWEEANAVAVARARETLSDIWESERFDMATLSVALRAVRTLVSTREEAG
ncbi:NAD-glutamate dehydrogenase [Allonocardiopsis opalescens]|uniref:Glutamate dehydrogenase n=1 Tax=Allonocardiopsis opalescens TaxID=1144618 RepID=A0A2T0QCE1_9ACTN|nr:NAD-glutamate dehydrogenase [Allonocardiopsis opalescens]PRY01540.1 glutamate dehydrogenase [Allonocardiopsis opalescens]